MSTHSMSKHGTGRRSMREALVLSMMAAAAITACGGGGGDGDQGPAATAQVPASASASAAGFIEYLKALVKADADGLEAVDVSAVTPPADDAAEPSVVD
jgi:hypothetical protein